MRWLENLILDRRKKPESDLFDLDAMATMPSFLSVSGLMKGYSLSPEEKILLSIALSPLLFPPGIARAFLSDLGDTVNTRELLHGLYACKGNMWVPTLQTGLSVLAGNNPCKQAHYLAIFSPGHFLFAEDILSLGKPELGGYLPGATLLPSRDFLSLFLTGKSPVPNYGPDFPARQITTKLDWGELVVPNKTLQDLELLRAWRKTRDIVGQELAMSVRLRPGYRALFYGPPGTGKTFTASLLGKSFGIPVYRVDLSQVISKYIGETEKNLERVFSFAQKHDWIIFFDEADALFGKRGNVNDARDRYANQEISYLLQRFEDYSGLSILATNLKSNIDSAFLRRFESIVYFPMPGEAERLRLWNKAIPKKIDLASEIDLGKIARQFQLSGSSINNIVRYAVINCVSRESRVLELSELLSGIEHEHSKFGKVMDRLK